MTGDPSVRTLLGVAALAMVVAAAIALPTYFDNASNPTVFLRVGTYAPARPYVEREFPAPILTEDYGHDGQQFYVVADTFPDLHQATPYVDRIRYRARRILFPLLAAPFPAGPPLIWAMFAINLLAIGAAAAAMATFARRLRLTPWLGVVVGCTPALIESLDGSLADGLAFALALWGMVLWRRHLGWAIVLFSLAALSRETSLVAAVACFIVADRHARIRLLLVPAVFAVWSVVVIAWLPSSTSGDSSMLSEVGRLVTVPFKGWFQIGFGEPGTQLTVLLFAASVLAAVLLRDRIVELAWWLALDAALLVLSIPEIIERPMNAARVTPLAFPALVLGIAAYRSSPARPRASTAALPT